MKIGLVWLPSPLLEIHQGKVSFITYIYIYIYIYTNLRKFRIVVVFDRKGSWKKNENLYYSQEIKIYSGLANFIQILWNHNFCNNFKCAEQKILLLDWFSYGKSNRTIEWIKNKHNLKNLHIQIIWGHYGNNKIYFKKLKSKQLILTIH